MRARPPSLFEGVRSMRPRHRSRRSPRAAHPWRMASRAHSISSTRTWSERKPDQVLELWNRRLDRLTDYLKELQRSNTMSSTLTVTLPSDLEIQLTRDFDAPRELVFEAFSMAEHLAKWWGPAGSSVS